MTPAQLAALRSYIDAVVEIMTVKGDHSSAVRRVVNARNVLESAFERKLIDVTPRNTLPDIL